jgi:hypothetical protein
MNRLPFTQTNLLARAMLVPQPRMQFSANVQVVQDDPAGSEIESEDQRNVRLGIDTKFDKQQHAYVLSFPWNFDEIIGEAATQQQDDLGFWEDFLENSGCLVDFNNLFREFHQFCALPEPKGINRVCEPRLAEQVNAAVQRIQLRGLGIEMANLTVHQPHIKLLKCELTHGLSVDRDANGQKGDWNVARDTIMGAPVEYFTAKDDQRSFWDNFDSGKQPYTIAFTCMVESPMKLYVQNQNYSKVLFGSTNQDLVKNVVRFEANCYWTDMVNFLPVNNKKSLKWKITDFNDLMDANKQFEAKQF